jgi:hypothetical protein
VTTAVTCHMYELSRDPKIGQITHELVRFYGVSTKAPKCFHTYDALGLINQKTNETVIQKQMKEQGVTKVRERARKIMTRYFNWFLIPFTVPGSTCCSQELTPTYGRVARTTLL